MGEIRTALVEANGLTFEVDSCGEGKRLALLLHGFPECAYSWRHQLPLFGRLGYKAWAPNLRGYGGSSRPEKIRDYAMDRLAADVAGLIDAAGAETTLLVGHDWGGAIAWGFALEEVRPLERLIILNAPHPALLMERLRRWPQLLRSWYILFFQIPWLPEALLKVRDARVLGEMFRRTASCRRRFPEEVLRVYRENALRPGALKAMIHYYRAVVRNWPGRIERRVLRKVLHVPTLMIWGEKDVALGKELTYDTEALVQDLTLRYLPGVSHWVQQEAPETVNTMIEAWLKGQEVPRADEIRQGGG